MKKIIIFAVITAMLCSLFSFTAYASENKTPLMQKNAYDFLSTLGIVTTEEDESDTIVTREIFAVYLAKMLKINDNELNIRYFIDIEKDAFSANAINSLVGMGVISVSENRLFRPNDPITYSEALKMLIAILGGNELALSKGGWPSGYYSVASSMDINTSVNNVNAITVYEAADLIYHTMIVNTRVHYSGENYQFALSETNILESIWNIKYDEGTVASVYGATTDKSKVVTEKDEMYIGDERFKFKSISKDVFTLIGREIEYYYYDNDGNIPEIVFIPEGNKKANKDIDIDIADFISLQGENISFYNNKNKIEKEELANPIIIYNGVELGKDVQNTLKNLNKGQMSIIDGNADGKYDIVLIFDYRNFLVGNYSNNVLYNKLNNTDQIDLNEVEYLTVRNEKNEDTLISDVSVGEVLSVAQSKSGEFLLVRKSPLSFVGKVDSYNVKDEEIKIDSIKYKVDKSYCKSLFGYAKIGSTYVFNADVFGNICYISEGGEEQYKIGYFISTARIGTFDESLKARIMDENGEVKIYDIQDSVKIDGESYKKDKVDKVESVIAERAVGKLVAYIANEDGSVFKLDTQYKNETKENIKKSFTAVYGNVDEKRWYNDLNFAKKIPVRGDTKVYLVPLDGSTDIEKYAVKSVNEILITDVSYYGDAYLLDSENGFADAVLIAYDVADDLIVNKDTRTTPFVFLEMEDKLNESGNVAKYITGCTPSGVMSYEVSDNISFDGLEPGDFIRLWYDIKGRVVKSGSASGDFSIIYDCSKTISEQMTDTNWIKIAGDFLIYKPSGLVTNMSSYRSNFQVSYGTAVSVSSDGVLKISSSEDEKITESINVNNKTIIVVEKGRDKITARVGAISDVISHENSVQNCSKILNITAAGATRCIVVYNL